jgi:hypothetical protein
MDSFDISKCETYKNLWIWDLSKSLLHHILSKKLSLSNSNYTCAH